MYYDKATCSAKAIVKYDKVTC